MSTVAVIGRSRPDPMGKYWWFALAFLLLMIGGASLRWSAPRSGTPAGFSSSDAGEQDLDSLDSLRINGAPGRPIQLAMGSYARKTETAPPASSLPIEASGPAAAGAKDGSEGSDLGEADSLGAEMKRMAESKIGKRPEERPSKAPGKGGSAPASFSVAKAKFALSGFGSQGGAGTSASFLAAVPGLSAFLSGRSAPDLLPPAAAVRIRNSGGGGNQSLNQLAQVSALATRASQYGAEASVGLGAQGFDAGGTASSFPKGAATVDVEVPSDRSIPTPVPRDLKADNPDPKKVDGKAPTPPQMTPANNTAMQDRQIAMLLMQMAIGGLAGPMFNAMGMGLAGAVMGKQAAYTAYSNPAYASMMNPMMMLNMLPGMQTGGFGIGTPYYNGLGGGAYSGMTGNAYMGPGSNGYQYFGQYMNR